MSGVVIGKPVIKGGGFPPGKCISVCPGSPVIHVWALHMLPGQGGGCEVVSVGG